MLFLPGTQNEFISVVDVERSRLAEWPWSMGGGGAAELKDMLDGAAEKTLRKIADSIGITAVTGEDGIYTFPDRGATARLGLAEVIPLVTGDIIRDWCIEDSLQAVWPYDARYRLRKLEDIPGVIQLLWPYKKNISQRRRFGTPMLQKGAKWYEWQELYDDKFLTRHSIVFAFVATHNHFLIDRGGKVFNRSAPVIKLYSEANEQDHLSLLGLLNSSTAGFWMRQVFFPKGGDQVGNKKARVRRTWWEERFEYAANGMSDFPIPMERSGVLGQRLDSLAKEYTALLPARLVHRAIPARNALDDARDKAELLRLQMIALQEELDWQVYHLYGLTPEPLTLWRQTSRSAESPRTALEVCPHIDLGERAFEIVLGRKMARKELETAWFERHGSTPITELPAHWPDGYRRLVERRIRLIETDKNISLIEQPEFKRRWSLQKPKKTFRQAWAEMEQDALRGWLLDRLEVDRYWPRTQPGHYSSAELKSCRELARLAALDAEFQQVGEIYTGLKDFDVLKLVTELVLAESVPFLPVFRCTDSGLRKRVVWERVWEKQRAEDRGEKVEIEIPPKYKKVDFQKNALGREGLWRLRGELDVPKERWISYPPLAQRQGDEEPSPVVTWAGYTHLDQALALAKYFDERKERDVGFKEWMLPLIAGLDQLLPWLLQWHNQPDPAYEGHKMGDYFRDVVLPDALQSQELTLEQCRAWRPTTPARRPRQRKLRSG
jgi:hypothetical protein